jgi:hypothetical protein
MNIIKSLFLSNVLAHNYVQIPLFCLEAPAIIDSSIVMHLLKLQDD